MKLVKPDYYDSFRCIAEKCRHSCCIGWEIDIDEDTLDLYENIPGEFGERLRQGINYGESACFKTDECGRCVFLNDRGLCDIILNLGENTLCDICTDHPRFRNQFSNRTEMGLGLCCEEACRLILSKDEAVQLIEMNFDDGSVPTDEEAEFFADRDEVIKLLQDRSKSLSERFDILSREWARPNTKSPAEWVEFYRSLERLDSAWDGMLDILELQESFAVVDDYTVWENLAVYIIYRHGANLSLWDSVAFAVHTVQLLYTISRAADIDFEGICDLCRMWSGEIEYSEENTDAVIETISF